MVLLSSQPRSLFLSFMLLMQDGEIWTFTVRALDSPLPDRTINVNYDGFAEGNNLFMLWLEKNNNY